MCLKQQPGTRPQDLRVSISHLGPMQAGLEAGLGVLRAHQQLYKNMSSQILSNLHTL